ncbi:MAG: ABC transporter ATP-binding protein/permease [Oscillospiraceae bacterium]|jgi:ABC-type multidrug transport system fused ATPase/permease subunit|nr:ABC transporter ATP-binding protein/permease [Oscillospiraceae bacterium]
MSKEKIKKEKPAHSILDNIFYLLKDICANAKILFALMLVEVLCAIVAPMFGIYLPKIAVDLVARKADAPKIFMTLGLFALAMTAVNVMQSVAGSAKYAHSNNMRFYYFRKIHLKSYTCDYKNIESADGRTRHQKAKNCFDAGDGSGSSKMIWSMIAIFTSAVSFILYSSVLSLLNPLIILFLTGLTAINFAASARARKYDEKHRDKSSELGRKLWYVQAGSRDVKAGKDTRLYGMKPWFMSLRENLLSEYFALRKKIQNRYYMSGVIHGLTLLLRDGAAYAYLIYMVSSGKVDIGDFVLYFGAIAGFSGFINNIAENINNIGGANVQMNDARAFLECSDAPEPANPAKLPPLDSAISISFKNVDFSYSEESGKTLDDFNFEIKAGEKIALVGVNGAGKTTIVKLLCGFYAPDSGEVLIDGVNIKNFRKQDLYKLFSAVFQDIVVMPFTVGENVSMTADGESDRDRIWQSLETAGLREEIEKYERGIDAPMLKELDENGVVLSGGQQQKLLMARALYKDAPLLILDEPTAALDPIAESETYEMFHRVSKTKTALYISHRLASTRFCDRIIFLKDGKAAEIGSHAELMQKGGEYANMFEIQSHYYKKNENTEAPANG